MAVKYYRPNKRRTSTLVPTKKFFILLGIAAAVIVAIILIVTLSGTNSNTQIDRRAQCPAGLHGTVQQKHKRTV